MGLGKGGIYIMPTESHRNRTGNLPRAAAAELHLRWTRFLFRAALSMMMLCHCIPLVQMDNPTDQPKMTRFTSGRKPLTQKPRLLQCIECWRGDRVLLASRFLWLRAQCICMPELIMCHACWSTPSSHLCTSPLLLFTPTCGCRGKRYECESCKPMLNLCHTCLNI